MFGDVTSANIVGYATQEEISGGQDFVQITPMFDSVSQANQIKLSEMSFGAALANNDNIQMFDENGDVITKLVWKTTQNQWQLIDYTTNPSGDKSYVDDYTFTRGRNFWVALKNSMDFTQSGAVNKNEIVYTSEGGQAFVQAGNPRPVELKLSDIKFGLTIANNDNIQMFDANGDVLKKLVWKTTQNQWQLIDYTSNPSGDKSYVDDYTFQAGEHFWFATKNSGTITIPGIKL